MTNIDIDSTKIKETGYDIINLGLEYSEIINTIFDKINGYSQADIWVGASSEKYIALVNTEKSSYDAIGNIINSYGKSLVATAERYEEFAKGSERDG